ncbi:hypothetical protein [Glycomyces sp. NPDC047010]|uniref:hypothetical protein n=1 Tax=Glycomyces sp. NPDC047010 TaxID=3155023 RepID=UPI0033E0400C
MVRKAPDSSIVSPAVLDCPAYLTRCHRAVGIALAAFAVGALQYLRAHTALAAADDAHFSTLFGLARMEGR